MNINTIRPDEHNFLKRLTTLAAPPKSLYYIGSLPDKPQLTVAIVGTRRPTAYGRTVTEQIASALARKGALIVSGIAIGVDAIAHASALDAGGHTLAVLPSGVDDPYPKSNQQLARRILEHGDALISEYEPSHRPMSHDFLWRNRLVSGLSDAVIVTEANLRSGTLSTVAHALEQGRDVYVVPGPITSPLSAGCNRLIAQGATPITDVESLLEQLGLTGQTVLALGDSPEEATILELLRQGISDGDELQVQSGYRPEQLAQTLTMLEIKGMVKSLGGNMWRL
jgi:DNA processing protein